MRRPSGASGAGGGDVCERERTSCGVGTRARACVGTLAAGGEESHLLVKRRQGDREGGAGEGRWRESGAGGARWYGPT